eukprot:Gb_14673 [translate_table: standard]
MACKENWSSQLILWFVFVGGTFFLKVYDS